jgi:hypothetical protein
VIVAVIVGAFVGLGRQRFTRIGFHFPRLQLPGFALGGFARSHLPVILPGVEHQMQPRHHLFDRRQRARRAGLAARTGFASRAGFTLDTGFAPWAWLALRTGLAWWAGFAARTFRSWPAGMALRSRASGFAGLAARTLRPLFAFPDHLFVRHLPAPNDSERFLADV